MRSFLSPIVLSMARVTQLCMLMRNSQRPLARELAHKVDALLKICQLKTAIPLTPVCMTPPETNILITTKVTHAQLFLLSPCEMYGSLDARLVLRCDLRSGPLPTPLPLAAIFLQHS